MTQVLFFFAKYCTDEEKKMRSAELYNKFNNTKIKFTGENSKHISKSLVKNSDAFNKSALDYQHNNSFSNQFNQKQTSSIKVYEDTHQKILYNSEDLLSESMDEESKDSLFVNNCSNNMKISIKTKANKFKKRNSCSSGSESNNYELSEESKRNEEFLIDENRKEYNKDTLITFQKLQTTKAIPNLDMKSRTKNQNVKFMTLDDNKGYNINENTIIELQNEQRKNSQKWIDSCECKKNGEIHNKISLANDCKSDVDNQEIEEIHQAHADCLEHYKVFKIELRNKNKEKKRECKLKRKLNNNLLDVCNESKPSTRFSGASIENIPYTGNIQVHEKERDHDLLSFIEENEEKIEDHHISPCSNNIQESDVHLQSNIANHKISHEESITILC